MAEAIDEKIKSVLDERYKYVKETLKSYAEAIENMTAELLDKEVIEGKKVREIIEEFETKHNLESRLAHKAITDKEDNINNSNGNSES